MGKSSLNPKQNRGVDIERVLGRFFIVLSSVIFCFIFIEAGFRVAKSAHFRPSWMMDGISQYPRPYVMMGGQPLAGDYNVLGYRGRLPSIKKNPDEFRVFILGGSVVHNGRPPFSELLEKKFHENGFAHLRVFNFGAVSSLSRQDVVRVLFDVSGYEPDLVVFYGGGNDLLASVDSRINYPHSFVLVESSFSGTESGSYGLFTSLALGSVAVRTLFPNLLYEQIVPPSIKQQISASRKWSEEGSRRVEAYIQNLRFADAISRDFNAEFLAVFQPLTALKVPQVGIEKKYSSHRVQELHKILPLELKKLQNPIRFVDLADLFNGINHPVFWDSIHINQEAHPVVAETLFKVIKPLVKNRPHPARDSYWPETHFLSPRHL